MAKTRQQKEQDLQELSDRLKNAKSIVLADYRGTTVKEIDTFRRALSSEGVQSKVYKVSLLKKAYEANGIATGELDYKLPVIVSVSQEDEVAPARIINNIAKEVKTINILSGVVLGMAKEIDGFIDEYQQRYNNFNVHLTGGDIVYLAPHLKNQIFADPELIFKGLYAISEVNNS